MGTLDRHSSIHTAYTSDCLASSLALAATDTPATCRPAHHGHLPHAQHDRHRPVPPRHRLSHHRRRRRPSSVDEDHTGLPLVLDAYYKHHHGRHKDGCTAVV